MKDKIRSPFGGPIEIGYVDDETGLWTPVQVKARNTVMNQSADILGKLAIGDWSYAISHVYFEYDVIAGAAIEDAVLATDTAASYASGTTVNSYLRDAINAAGVTSTSGSPLVSDQATLFGVTSSTVPVGGPLGNLSTSHAIVGAALVAAPTGNVSGDLMFARFAFTTPIPKLASSQIGVKWTLTF